MSEEFEVKKLPDIDREQIEKGNCPWCLTKVCDGSLVGSKERPHDFCPDCGDVFYCG